MEGSTPRPLALVTGASSGIGLELARQFATNGFDVVIAAEDDELTAAAQDLAGTGASVEAVRADLATPGASRSHVVDRLDDAGGPTRRSTTRRSRSCSPSR
jgi:uncharacterized protein